MSYATCHLTNHMPHVIYLIYVDDLLLDMCPNVMCQMSHVISEYLLYANLSPWPWVKGCYYSY